MPCGMLTSVVQKSFSKSWLHHDLLTAAHIFAEDYKIGTKLVVIEG